LGPVLAEAATALRLGAPAEQVFARARGQRELDRLADVLTQAATGGTAPAAAVARLAQEARERAAHSARAAARRAGVLVVLPLGLCFLPAFVLLGVVPVVAGIAGRLLP
jgi:pilus assembly protein TadC